MATADADVDAEVPRAASSPVEPPLPPLDEIVAALTEYRWLARTYVIEYHVERLAERLPPAWQAALAATPLPEVTRRLLSGDDEGLAAWPDSLRAYAVACRRLALDRRPRGFHGAPPCELDRALLSGLSDKKRHEIERLVPVVAHVVRAARATLVVDIGSGVGHLARTLAYLVGVDVVGIEGNPAYVAGAVERDAKCAALLAGRARAGDAAAAALLARRRATRHLAHFVRTDTDGAAFEALVRRALDLRPGAPTPPLVIVGLHTCGDLGPTLLRLFAEQPFVRGVVSVACCYMHMTEDSDDEFVAPPPAGRLGYPLSRAVADRLPDAHLGWKLREMACHALDAYEERCQGSEDMRRELRSHGYRAALEVLLRDLDPANVRRGLGSLKGGWAMTFREYATTALQRLSVAAPDLAWERYEALAERWEDVAKFFCVRVILSPVLEALLLQDRLLWLRECGHDANLWPAFDPSVSPRNFVLYANKPVSL